MCACMRACICVRVCVCETCIKIHVLFLLLPPSLPLLQAAVLILAPPVLPPASQYFPLWTRENTLRHRRGVSIVHSLTHTHYTLITSWHAHPHLLTSHIFPPPPHTHTHTERRHTVCYPSSHKPPSIVSCRSHDDSTDPTHHHRHHHETKTDIERTLRGTQGRYESAPDWSILQYYV